MYLLSLLDEKAAQKVTLGDKYIMPNISMITSSLINQTHVSQLYVQYMVIVFDKSSI